MRKIIGRKKDPLTFQLLLTVVCFLSDYIAVIYLGQIVEIGPAEAIYTPPYHPYTEALLSAVPVPDPSVEQTHIMLSGPVPAPLTHPGDVVFIRGALGEQCFPRRERSVKQRSPLWREAGKRHRILCHIPLEDLNTIEPVVHTMKGVIEGF